MPKKPNTTPSRDAIAKRLRDLVATTEAKSIAVPVEWVRVLIERPGKAPNATAEATNATAEATNATAQAPDVPAE